MSLSPLKIYAYDLNEIIIRVYVLFTVIFSYLKFEINSKVVSLNNSNCFPIQNVYVKQIMIKRYSFYFKSYN